MPAGFVNVPVGMYAEMELLASVPQSLIQRGQEHVTPSAEIVHGYGQQGMVLTGIAHANRGIPVRPGAAPGDKFAPESILQIDQFGFVKLDICHKTKF